MIAVVENNPWPYSFSSIIILSCNWKYKIHSMLHLNMRWIWYLIYCVNWCINFHIRKSNSSFSFFSFLMCFLLFFFYFHNFSPTFFVFILILLFCFLHFFSSFSLFFHLLSPSSISLSFPPSLYLLTQLFTNLLLNFCLCSQLQIMIPETN